MGKSRPAPHGVREGSEGGMKFEIEKGSIEHTFWTDLYLLWRDHGNVRDQDEFISDWSYAMCAFIEKYKPTTQWDLCRELSLTLDAVIQDRMKGEKQNGKG